MSTGDPLARGWEFSPVKSTIPGSNSTRWGGFRGAVLMAFVIVAVSSGSIHAEAVFRGPVLYRIFLGHDERPSAAGRSPSIVTFGDYARVGDRVVFSLPLSADPSSGPTQLVSIPSARVDWPATDRFAESARHQRRATHGGDFDLTSVPAAFVRPSSLRTGAAELPRPGLQDMVEQALTIVELTSVPAERLSVLDTVIALLDESVSGPAGDWKKTAWESATRRRRDELKVGRSYAVLGTEALAEATRLAADADVRGVQAVVDRVVRQDDRLGNRRPNHVLAVVTAIDHQLQAAQALRLSRDHWEFMIESYRRYDAMSQPVVEGFLDEQADLDDVRLMAGPRADRLDGLEARLTHAREALDTLSVPDGLRTTHGLLRQAFNLAVQSAIGRRAAVQDGNLDTARDAASAAAGAFLLFERATDDLKQALTLPALD